MEDFLSLVIMLAVAGGIIGIVLGIVSSFIHQIFPIMPDDGCKQPVPAYTFFFTFA